MDHFPTRTRTVSDFNEPEYRAAWYYYHDNLTQHEISIRLGTSRATVGRLLDRARRTGLVHITLDPVLHQVYGVGAELIRRFGLDDAVVVPGEGEGHDTLERLTSKLAAAGGRYLSGRLQPGQLLAIGWGNTVSRALLSMKREVLADIRVVTLTGGVDPYLRAVFDDPSDSQLAHRGFATMIPAPMLASSPTLAQALMDESAVRQPLDEAQLADIAVVGIGSTPDNPTITQLGYQTERELEMYARAGIVGDILGRFFHADGTIADIPLHKRVIGTDLDQLRRMKNVIAIAGGQQKVPAITAALRGRYFEVLVTDADTAAAILQLSDNEGDIPA